MLDANKVQLLTEDDVRRIARLEIEAWGQSVMRKVEDLAAEDAGGEG
jgi:hypothetical protein